MGTMPYPLAFPSAIRHQPAPPTRDSNLKVEFHSVISEPHMRRQDGVGRLMWQVVANMRKERPLRLHPLHDAQGILHRRVRGMRLVPERVQKKNVQPFQLAKRRHRYFAVIGEIRRRPKAEAIDLSIAM